MNANNKRRVIQKKGGSWRKATGRNDEGSKSKGRKKESRAARKETKTRCVKKYGERRNEGMD
jgi:hypothetical protein